MADDVLNRIEKHMEGNTLALSAVAEVRLFSDPTLAS